MMGDISSAFDFAWREYEADQVPASGAHEPVKADIRAAGKLIDAAVDAVRAAVATGTVAALIETRVYATASALPLSVANGLFALVYADPVRANNDLWRKNGAAGSGSWVNTGIFLGNIEAAVASVSAAANDATGARALLERIYQRPLALPVNGNPNSLTYSAASGSQPVDQVPFEVMIAANNTGPVTINAAGLSMPIVEPGTGAALTAGRLVGGTIVTLTRSVPGGNVAVLGASRPALVPNTALASDLDVTDAAFEALLGVPVARPAPTVNKLDVGGTAPTNNQEFEAYIATTNTGATTLTKGGVVNRIVSNMGTGAELVGGELVPGTIRKFLYSQDGSAYILGAAREPTFAASADANPVGSQDDDLAFRPYGAVSNNGSGGGSVVTPINKTVVVLGSSNAAVSHIPNGARPDQLITAALNAEYVGTGINFGADLRATDGAPWVSATAQLQASAQFMANQAVWVFPFFWMNDVRTIFYHDNGGVTAEFDAIVAAIEYIRSKGAEPVIPTGFHPDPRQHPEASGVRALDPFFFSSTAAYPDGGSTRSMAFPVNKAAPVSPVADMVPAATKAEFMVERDWSGSGVIRTGYKRLWHFNRTVREICAAHNVAVLDLEASSYRNCLETVPDLSAGLDTFYNGLDPLHPKGPLFLQGVKPVIDQWARHVVQGRNDQRVFTGF